MIRISKTVKDDLIGVVRYLRDGLNPCNTEEIETDRLLLRRFAYEDAKSMLSNWAGDDCIQHMYGEPSYKTIDAVRNLLHKYIEGYNDDYYFRWAVIEKESGECIGQIAYFLVDGNNHFGEIEYCIGTAFQGRGYASEATRAVIDYGFDKIGFHKVQICVRPSNITSRRVIEKCGFIYEGTLRDYFYIDGKYEDRMYFSIIRKDSNPWEDISLSDYENHMRLDSVRQLQTLNEMMKQQFELYDVSTCMVLGVAAGNGLEHVSKEKYQKVYGIDINKEYLKAVYERYPDLLGILECMCLDLTKDCDRLPHAEFVIADLLIEYIGYEAFLNAVKKIRPKYVSCIIQINIDMKNWVSDSPYLHCFDRLDDIHHSIEGNELSLAMEKIGYKERNRLVEELPNGKALMRLDYVLPDKD
ncbi:MAG: GNAT family N-acetyltransferase [Lachnospiraceae bacterium]|nr:GNAT family N-acetyltransferase [Lachnospiraceae bacterium]